MNLAATVFEKIRRLLFSLAGYLQHPFLWVLSPPAPTS